MDNNIFPLGSKECGNYLKETYKKSINKTVFLQDDVYEKIKEYDEISNYISELEVEKKKIEHFLQNEMRECEIAFCKERKITWKPIQKNLLDSSLLKKENPELASRYNKTSQTRVFKVY